MYKVNIFILFMSFLTISIYGQDINRKIQKADSLVQNKEYQKAEILYKEIIKSEPGNNLAIYKLASLYYSEKKYDKAIKNYLILAPNKNPTVLYNLACTYSLINNKSEALKYLKEAVDNGFSQVSLLKTDTDLTNIRNDKEFIEIIKSAKSIENFPEAKKFDFWVGKWNVYNPQKQKVGDSRIEKILDEAVILENWTGVNGYRGKSFNHYDMDKNKWVQYWVDQNSNSIYFEGNFDSTQNAIVYFSDDHANDTSPFIRKLTFYNLGPDEVRQFSQRSTDKGESWTTEYDFTYIRKENNSK